MSRVPNLIFSRFEIVQISYWLVVIEESQVGLAYETNVKVSWVWVSVLILGTTQDFAIAIIN